MRKNEKKKKEEDSEGEKRRKMSQVSFLSSKLFANLCNARQYGDKSYRKGGSKETRAGSWHPLAAASSSWPPASPRPSASHSVDLPAETTLFLKENSLTGPPSYLHNGGYSVPRHSFTFGHAKTPEPGAGYETQEDNRNGGKFAEHQGS